MVKLTQSMLMFLKTFYPNKLSLIMFGHIELFTNEMAKEYQEWCLNGEGKEYLKGGSKYDEAYAKQIGVE